MTKQKAVAPPGSTTYTPMITERLTAHTHAMSAESLCYMDETEILSQSQNTLAPVFSNQKIITIEDHLSLSSIGDETVIGGFNVGPLNNPTVNKGHLKILYSNVDSFSNKIDELKTFNHNGKYDVICITETMPKNSDGLIIDHAEWKIDRYNMFVSPPNVFTGRGCLIYTKEELKAFQIDTKIYEFMEYVQIGIHNGTEDKLLLTCIYRSSSASSTSCIKELEEILQTNKIDSVEYSYLLYVGDFNFKEIDWENNNTSVGPDRIATKFLETVRDTYLYQHVREATRYRSDNQPSLLDLVFANEEGMIESIVHNSPIGNSDNEVLEFEFQFGTIVNKTSIQQRLLFFKGNYEAINKKLRDIDWDLELVTGDIENLWNSFADRLSNTYKEFIPVSNSKPKRFDTPWVNEETLAAILLKRRL